MNDKDIKKESNRGGKRENAGRPSGSKNKVSTATAQTVVEMLYDKTGQIYEELLIEDFLKARATDSTLAHKYHSLLANKVMPTLTQADVKIEQSGDAVNAKAQAFAEALATLRDINKDKEE